MDKLQQKCIKCGLSFKGRLDKKFCTEQCKSDFNNRKAWKRRRKRKRKEEITGSIHKILWRNRKILLKLLDEGTTEILESDLEDLGFRINFITHFEVREEGVNNLNVYDIGCYSDKKGKMIIYSNE